MRRKYTTKDLELIKSCEYTLEELASIFETTADAVSHLRRRHNIQKYKSLRKTWTSEEEELLKSMVAKRWTKKRICKHLDRSLVAVNTKLRELGMQRFSLWTEEELNFLIENYDNYTYVEFAITLKRTHNAVRNKLKRLREAGEIKSYKFNRGNAQFGRILWRG